jgi:hypothetical protein
MDYFWDDIIYCALETLGFVLLVTGLGIRISLFIMEARPDFIPRRRMRHLSTISTFIITVGYFCWRFFSY